MLLSTHLVKVYQVIVSVFLLLIESTVVLNGAKRRKKRNVHELNIKIPPHELLTL